MNLWRTRECDIVEPVRKRNERETETGDSANESACLRPKTCSEVKKSLARDYDFETHPSAVPKSDIHTNSHTGRRADHSRSCQLRAVAPDQPTLLNHRRDKAEPPIEICLSRASPVGLPGLPPHRKPQRSPHSAQRALGEAQRVPNMPREGSPNRAVCYKGDARSHDF